MAIPCYLAMTAAEMEREATLPEALGWMACHFSLSGKGVTNLPRILPPGALLMLDDATPVSGHDPELVARQLEETAERLSCSGIWLDFQRPDQEETAAMAAQLCRRLPGRVIVSAVYAKEAACSVCLPPVPCTVPLQNYLHGWKDRDIWLEAALTTEIWNVTEKGAKRREVLGTMPPEEGFWDESLHCHYRMTLVEDGLQFILWRTVADLENLQTEAEQYGVKAMVGLWQELG